jgi:hypothetical protein
MIGRVHPSHPDVSRLGLRTNPINLASVPFRCSCRLLRAALASPAACPVPLLLSPTPCCSCSSSAARPTAAPPPRTHATALAAARAPASGARLATPAATPPLLLRHPPGLTTSTRAANARRCARPWRGSRWPRLLLHTATTPRCRRRSGLHWDMMNVASSHFKCFRCFRDMLQAFIRML